MLVPSLKVSFKGYTILKKYSVQALLFFKFLISETAALKSYYLNFLLSII